MSPDLKEENPIVQNSVFYYYAILFVFDVDNIYYVNNIDQNSSSVQKVSLTGNRQSRKYQRVVLFWRR